MKTTRKTKRCSWCESEFRSEPVVYSYCSAECFKEYAKAQMERAGRTKREMTPEWKPFKFKR